MSKNTIIDRGEWYIAPYTIPHNSKIAFKTFRKLKYSISHFSYKNMFFTHFHHIVILFDS